MWVKLPHIEKQLSGIDNILLGKATSIKDLYGYPQCLVRMARFRGTTKEEFIDNKRAEDNIYE